MDKKQVLLNYHNEKAKDDHMVYEVWEDGEITLTKGGDLYGMRSLHLIKGGDVSKAWPADCFPVKFKNGHACVQVFTGAEAEAVSSLILEGVAL